MEGIVTIAVLDVTTDGMAHIGCMDAYLILAASLQLELHKGIAVRAVENGEMGDSVLAAIIHWG